MKLDFRQRLLTTTLLVGASMVASPVLAQTTPPPSTPSPPDNSATPSTPETTTSVEGQTTVPSTSATGETVRGPQDIVITGTRIPQPNLTSASPVTVISAQEIKLQGTSRTEDLINSLPQSFAAQGSNVSNGSTGTATVNLRGLGSARTIVLINGRRAQPGDPRAPATDLNFIPAALVKRVDVLTGGASSVYGADAVAGVVNFIMDTNFRGFRIDAQASVFNHNNRTNDQILNANENRGFRPPHGMSTNGGAQDLSVAFGAGFDDNRGSVMAYATYRKQDPVLQSSRDYSFCSLGARDPAYFAGADYGNFYCGGSSTNTLGRFRFFNPVIGTRSSGRVSRTLGPNAANGTGVFVPGFALFNFAPYNFYQRPDERYTLGAFAEYEISPGAKPYLEAMFMDDQSNSQIAPSGDFGNTLTINCDNPLLSPQQRAAVCRTGNFVGETIITDPTTGIVTGIGGTPTVFTGPTGTFNRANFQINRRDVEGGGRQDDLEHISYRLVGGIRGDLLRGLSYDAYYQYGTTRLSQTYLNDFSVRRLTQAIDVVTDPTTGLPVCRGTLDGTADAGCVPWNIFARGGVTPDAVAFLSTPGFSRGNVNQTIAHADFTLEGGEYGVQTPWSDRGVGLNAGFDYVKNSLKFNTDTEFQTGDLAGQGGPTLPVQGHYDVREAFAEIQIPIISHSFIEEFTVGAGYRYSDYNVADHHFNTDTYKVSVELAPIPDIRARASYNRAVRAPNVIELFGPVTLGLAGGTDPCSAGSGTIGTNQTQFTLAQCLNTFLGSGLTVAQATTLFNTGIEGNPANQYGARFGGSTALAPEKADTYTVGVILQPRWVPGFALTLDYFDIKVKGLIGNFGFQNVVNTCALTGNPTFCNLIHRDVLGSLTLLPTGFVDLLNVNTGGLRTKGLDINAAYQHKIGGMGTLNASLVGTWLKDLVVTPFDVSFDCAKFFGATCGTPNPEWRHKFRVGFTLPNGLGISGQWRYFSSVKNDTTSNDPDMPPGNDFPGNHKLNAKSFFDLALTARLADRYNFRVGANNILDTDPPVAGGDVVGPPFGNGNTFPQVYDALGRYMFAGVTIDF